MKSDESNNASMLCPTQARAQNTIPGNQCRIEATLLFLLGLGFLVFSSSKIHLLLLNVIHRSEMWEKRSDAITQLCIFNGLGFLFLAILSLICIRRGGTLASRVMAYLLPAPGAMLSMTRQQLREAITPRRSALWLAAALVLGIAARAHFLHSPMKTDEVFTFFGFIRPFPFLFEYTAPNNHVLNTILERISTLILGNHPVAIRLPAFLAGVASIPLIFLVCRTLRPGNSGYFAAAALAVWPYLILYSANGRGYSLVVFLTLILVLIGYEYVNHSTRAGVGLIAITSALGLFTMPSMLFTVVGTCAWVAWLLSTRGQTPKSILLEFAMPCAGLTMALTALLYTPVILVSGGFHPILRNRFVIPQPWDDFFQQLGPHLRETMSALTWGIPWLALVAIAALVVAGLCTSARHRNWPVLMLLPLILASSAVVLIAQHHIPFERTWIFVLPLIIVVADAGFTRALDLSSPRFRPMAIATLFLFAITLAAQFIAAYPPTKFSDFPQAAVAAQFLKPILTQGDTVITSYTAEEPTFFYLWYDTSTTNLQTRKTQRPQERFYMGSPDNHYSFMSYDQVNDPRQTVTTNPTANSQRVFFVVKKSECTLDASQHLHILLQSMATLDFPANRIVKILDYGDMAIYRQRNPADPLATTNEPQQ